MSNWKSFLEFVENHQCRWPLNPQTVSAENSGTQQSFGIHLEDTPPHNVLLGPVFPRGKTSGVILQGGHQLFAWGDTLSANMTFSVTKTYLALLTGRALQEKLLSDLDEHVLDTLCKHNLPTLGFDSEHNAAITWRHLLQFTSEWQGECFGVPDQVDHHRLVALQPQPDTKTAKGEARTLQPPGSYWEYNDVRINQFSRALLYLFGRALPDILNESVMQPLGLQRASNATATDGWHWHGYDNSWIELNGQQLQSVPGGGHWGGGMVISAEHQVQLAAAMMNAGNAQRTSPINISSDWLAEMRTPCEIAPYYGFFTWLNTGQCITKAAPESCYFAMGVGGQLVLHDPDADLAAVLRWIDADYTTEIIQLMYESI